MSTMCKYPAFFSLRALLVAAAIAGPHCFPSSAAGFSTAAFPQAGGGQDKQQRPNFLFILIDDLGWTDLSCQGSTFYETPNIDKLAREGMRFTSAYAAAPVCSPTRASILTGKYPARLHLT